MTQFAHPTDQAQIPVRARVPLSPGEKGCDETIEIMTAVAHHDADAQELVKQTAQAIMREKETAEGRLFALYDFLRGHVQFLADAQDREQVRRPYYMLGQIKEHGYTRGDCDDLATLAVALLRAMNLPAYFVVMSLREERDFHHVFYASRLPNGPIVPFDPQEKYAPGVWPPAAKRKVYPA